MECCYCQREISSHDSYQTLSGDFFHKHCFQIVGVELTDTPWEEMLPREQEALNLYLSQESFAQLEEEV